MEAGEPEKMWQWELCQVMQCEEDSPPLLVLEMKGGDYKPSHASSLQKLAKAR